MNTLEILIILLVLIGLHLSGRVSMLGWLLIWPLAVYAFVRLGISPWVPASVLKLYLGLTILGLLAYVYADEKRYDEIASKCTRFIVDERFTLPLYTVAVLLPLGLAVKIYFDMNAPVRAPTFGRTVHPAAPNEISYKGKKINLITARNPLRPLETSDPEKFRAHVENGKTVYYENCVYCHGDDMRGDGIFAHGLIPVPANFNSDTILPQFQEGFFFWRIAKGGPGLPAEAGPWSSSMPAWENFLEEEQVWEVILYLYDYTGLKPRAEEEH